MIRNRLKVLLVDLKIAADLIHQRLGRWVLNHFGQEKVVERLETC